MKEENKVSGFSNWKKNFPSFEKLFSQIIERRIWEKRRLWEENKAPEKILVIWSQFQGCLGLLKFQISKHHFFYSHMICKIQFLGFQSFKGLGSSKIETKSCWCFPVQSNKMPYLFQSDNKQKIENSERQCFLEKV